MSTTASGPSTVTEHEAVQVARANSSTAIDGRGHSLNINAGWQEVADTALRFVQRFDQ